MHILRSKSILHCVSVLLIIAPLSAQNKTILEAFAVQPAELIATVTQQKPPDGAGMRVLLDDSTYSFDDQGRSVYTWRRVFQILAEEKLADWAAVSADWAPWHQDKPLIRARVVTKDGQEHWLDSKTMTQSPAHEYDRKIFSDRLTLRAPLPAIAVGAIVEQEIVTRDTVPFFSAGSAHRLGLAMGIPLARTRLVISAPTSLNLQVKPSLLPAAAFTHREEGGRNIFTIDHGPVDATERVHPFLPPDSPRRTSVDFSIGTSWQQIATQYAKQVDAQIGKADLRALLAGLPANGSREAFIRQAMVRLHREVRYTGMELGEASLIPQTPAEVLKRHYGDCKDKAALLVAMLRTRQIPADVALLSTGPGRDIDPTLPGLGLFDHAIVHVGGSPEYWIDATDEYATLGTLPTMDHGRWAMVANSETLRPLLIPELLSSENRTVELREVRLADRGPASVVEITEPGAHPASGLRQYYAANDLKDVTKSLEGYVKRVYLADKLTKLEFSMPSELEKPFRLRLEMAKALRGATDMNVASVAVFPVNLTESLPEYFREEEPKDAEKLPPRTSDFYYTEPYMTEWRYRIIPPVGFRSRPLPKTSAAKYGPASLSQEFSLEPDGAVAAVFRFDSGRGRLSPAAAKELRQGLLALAKAEPLYLNFDQTGELLLSQGKVKEALAEFRALAQKSPQDAMPRIRIANALLKSGLGEAAREEAREATRIEPGAASAWKALGWILQHDLVGRLRRPGLDLPGAIAAYSKAKALEPEEWTTAADLAILLEHDAMGERYTSKANLQAAIDVYRAIGAEKLKTNGLGANLHYALLYAGRVAELRALLEGAKGTASARLVAVIAAAADKGAAEGLREAATISDEAERRQATLTAGNTLAKLRLYPAAAELLAAGAQGSPNGARVLGLANLARNAKRLDQIAMPADEPVSVVRRIVSLNFGDAQPTDEEILNLVTVPAREASLKDPKNGVALGMQAARRGLRAQAAASGFPVAVLGDLGMAATQFSVDGDNAMGFRVRMRVAKPEGGVTTETYFVLQEGDRYGIVGSGYGLGDVAVEVQRRAAANDLVGARRLLDWVRELVERAGGEDPFAGLAFPYLWERGNKSDGERIRYAAASLGLLDPASLPILQAARAVVTDENLVSHLNHAIAQASAAQDRPEDLLAAARVLLNAYPNSAAAFAWQNLALRKLKRYDEVEKAIAARLERLPDDDVAIRAGSSLALDRGHWIRLREWTERLNKAGKGGPGDDNNLAWAILVEKGATDEALQIAERGMAQIKSSFPILHTAAALYADAGRISEAREYLVQAMDAAQIDEPNSECRFVLGRIAEQLGFPAAARAQYTRVQSSSKNADDDVLFSTYALAQRRMARLP